MTAVEITVAGMSGVIAALLWVGIMPYFIARKKAEAEGLPAPSFAKEYLTTMVISTISGLIAVFMAISSFEQTLMSAQSVLIAAGMGFSFTFTVLGISNQVVDIKIAKIEESKVARLKAQVEDEPT